MKINIRSIIALCIISIVANISLQAQVKSTLKQKTISIPFEAGRFDTAGRKIAFTTYKGLKVMQIAASPLRQTTPVTLKNFNFTNGTIEFDGMPMGTFDDEIGINFHQKNVFNHESLYLRIQPDETPQRDDAIQYAPYIHGINLWDVMKPFRGYASIRNNSWNHFKLIISGKQMLVYINSTDKPTLKVSRLEGNFDTGDISFDGEAMFANLVISPNQTENLSPTEGPDWTDNDPTYIRRWQVTLPKYLERGRELTADDLPTDTAKWQPISTERRGLVNLIRRFEGNEFTSYPKTRRYVWLKTNIHSVKRQKTKLQLGFNKEVYVFLNKELLYIDKNEAGELYQKYPGGLLDIANTSFNLPLKEGDNELIIGIAVQNYGWGIAARVESLRDLFIQN
jgi:hypothetical protein